MKIPKEYLLLVILGLYLLAYLLEATVDPLAAELATPYQFVTSEYFSLFPFTTATIMIRSLAIFMTPLFLLSFIKGAHTGKAGTLLVLSALFQLYALQEVASGTTLVPLEWSISLALAGAALLVPMVLFFLGGMVSGTKSKLTLPEMNDGDSLEEK